MQMTFDARQTGIPPRATRGSGPRARRVGDEKATRPRRTLSFHGFPSTASGRARNSAGKPHTARRARRFSDRVPRNPTGSPAKTSEWPCEQNGRGTAVVYRWCIVILRLERIRTKPSVTASVRHSSGRTRTCARNIAFVCGHTVDGYSPCRHPLSTPPSLAIRKRRSGDRGNSSPARKTKVMKVTLKMAGESSR